MRRIRLAVVLCGLILSNAGCARTVHGQGTTCVAIGRIVPHVEPRVEGVPRARAKSFSGPVAVASVPGMETRP